MARIAEIFVLELPILGKELSENGLLASLQLSVIKQNVCSCWGKRLV
jgi:hypothetical protein